MKRRHLWLAPVLMMVGNLAVHADVDGERLRALVRMPTLSTTFLFTYGNDQGYRFNIGESGADDEQTPESISKELRGDDTDAERYYRLGRLYSERKDQKQASAAWQRSLEIYQRQAQRAPESGSLQAKLARVLNRLERKADRDAAIAQALTLAPKDAEVWSTRADIETGDADVCVFGPNADSFDFSPTQFAEILKNKPSESQVHEAERLFRLAQDDLDKAVSLAPKSDLVYARRGSFQAWQGALTTLLQKVQTGGSATEEAVAAAQIEFARSMLKPEMVKDMVEAARLSRNEPFAVGLAAFYTMMGEVANKSEEDRSRDNGWLKLLTPQAQETTKEFMTKLEQMSQAPNRELAGRSAMTLGMLQSLALTPAEAEPVLRRAYALLPDDPRTVELLTTTFVRQEHWADVSTLLPRAFQRHESNRWRLILAKAESKQAHWPEAERNVRAILEHSPEDLDGNLALSALLLRRATDTDSLRQAGEQLVKTSALTHASQSEDQSFSYAYLRGIYLGLTGDVVEARNAISMLQGRGDKDQEADLKSVIDLLSAQ